MEGIALNQALALVADTALSLALVQTVLLIRRFWKELSSILPDRWCCCGGELVTDSNVTVSAELIFVL